ncbi:unnamed protein product [Didymodactylos carnosus]|uniref:Uncharacterized protein n=1 Tax=Didymodactylos carnosus TaxID=1234261 RepID=A0A815EBT2_9BILA|nr:unnamed protein product [Didymodactylos carnosus]CAF1308306.1 unnamed protein product [Didymodactylos carnosus]CAF3827519.1 unnamed protein product [Didymodactylos carnosus]CAF4143518.1 unnamed protein product [Didymodactylos carnosus]
MSFSGILQNHFVYEILNKALRSYDIDTIISFRSFIKGLSQHLTVLYQRKYQGKKKDVLTVYRGQALSI